MSTEQTKTQTRAYWILTTLIVLPLLGGGITNTLHSAHPLETVHHHLGYPEYVLTILGLAKLIAAAIIAAPGLPRLKEWAYAGVAIDFIGAAASHAFVEGTSNLPMVIFPLALLGVAMGSWFLRPPSRRLAG